jgi:hypothetical protein
MQQIYLYILYLCIYSMDLCILYQQCRAGSAIQAVQCRQYSVGQAGLAVQSRAGQGRVGQGSAGQAVQYKAQGSARQCRAGQGSAGQAVQYRAVLGRQCRRVHS